MRKLLFAVSVVLLALASCNKEEVIETNEKESPVFTASIAGATKTTVSLTDGKVAWEEATDEITITDASSASAVYKIKSIDAETGKATFVIKDGETALGAGPYTATYGTAPATTQNYSATAGKLYMTAPETEDNSFTFTVQCGLMKLNLTQAGVNVKSIDVTGTPTGGSETTYTLNCTEAQSIASAKDFYIALPAGDYNKIVITASWGWTCTKTVKSTPLSVDANHIKPVTFTSLSFNPEDELSSLDLRDDLVDKYEDLEDLYVSQDIWGIQWTPSEDEDPENPGHLSAYEDPDNSGRFYSTFYDSQNAYIIPAGVKAYTGKMDRDNDKVPLTAINGDILPAGVAVLLYSAYDEIELIKTDSSAEFDGDNDFKGVDKSSYQEAAGYYMLSYGQCGLCFYKMTRDMMLSAHRAFLVFEPGIL